MAPAPPGPGPPPSVERWGGAGAGAGAGAGWQQSGSVNSGGSRFADQFGRAGAEPGFPTELGGAQSR